jgi:NitT/TauT family transport system substrate-binding protein
MFDRNFRFVVAAGAIVATSLAGAAAAAPREIVLGWPASVTMSLAPLAAATELGLLEKEGLKVKVVELKGASVVIPQVATKAVQIGGIGPEPLVIQNLSSQSPIPVRLFYNNTPMYPWELIVPDKSPVKAIEDLRGKKVGVQVLTNNHMPITRVLLQRHGLTAGKDYQFQPIGYAGQALFALTRGDADAYFVGWNEISNYKAMGAQLRILPMDPEFRTIPAFGYIAHEDTIKSDPQMLVGFARALTQATLVCQNVPEWCVRAMWKLHPQVKLKEGTEEEKLAKGASVLLDILKTQLTSGDVQTARMGAFPEEGWQNLVRILNEGGELPSPKFDAAKLYTTGLVDQINTFDRKALAETIARLKR